jgi:glycosyltransferase involved in cell wall biosynthesis
MSSRPYPKVLHLIANLQIGGTEGQLVQFADRSREPSRHHVACFYSIGPLGDAFPTRPIWLGRIGRRPADVVGNVRVLGALRRTIVRGRFDLVHAHLGLSEVIAAIVTPRRIPIVASRRGRNRGFESNPVLKLVEAAGHRRVDVLICNSTYLAQLTRTEDRWPPPVRVIHNAVDLERFAPLPAPAEDRPSVVVVANLHAYKGHDRFLHVMSLVRDRLPGARATLVGDGVELPRLVELARRLGLSDSVTFAGAVPDPRPHLESAHVAALASETEGFPNALLEAMAMGRPVVARRVGGVPELVRDGEDGFLVGSEPGEMADRLVEILRDGELRKRMGRSARTRAESFTWDRVVLQTEGVYEEVLGRRERR